VINSSPEHDHVLSLHFETGTSREFVTEPKMASDGSSMPFQIVYTQGGKIRISGELASPEQADEFTAAIQALKHLITPSSAASSLPEGKAWDDSDDDPPADAQPASSSASVSLMITQKQKSALRERGFTEEQIRQMKPQEAHRTLGLVDQSSSCSGAGA
jgi:hypothetical protein